MKRRPTAVSLGLLLFLVSPARGAPVTSTGTVATSSPGLGLSEIEVEGDDPFVEVEVVEPEGPPPDQRALFIEAIEVLGNEKTDRQVILRRLLVAAGDLVDDTEIEASRLRLLNTGFFKSVEFSLRRGSSRGRVLLVVEVKERNTILIDELYYGFSSVAPVFGGIGLMESNFLGRGVTVGGAFVIGKDRRAVELRTFVPDLSNTPLQLTGSMILLKGAELIDDQQTLGPQLDYQRLGGTLGFGYGVAPAQRISLVYRLESVRAERLPNLDPAVLRRAPSIQFDESVVSTITAAYELDTRDDPFVPTQGTRLALAVEVGSSLLGSAYEFSKYTGEIQQALSLFGDHSLNLRLLGGMIQGNAPFFDQFFLRDFAYFTFNRSALPRNVQLNFGESNDYDDLLVSAGAEYSIPILEGEDWLYRTFVYGGVDLSATASLDELQEDPTGRGTSGRVPLSFDVGLKFDTFVGNFTLSFSYLIDLVL
ncbi:MAG: BamA/TamA family outer membrane protein [Deltaproteobacteria bacterium]|jgi:outer membrane protein insertion porin family|nr:BamA/TamA family outer membrane protein [Deltaproteobacteria bacterium]